MGLLQRLFLAFFYLFGDRKVTSLALPSSPVILACLLNCWWDTHCKVTYGFICLLLILAYCSNVPLRMICSSMAACRAMNCNSLGRCEMDIPVWSAKVMGDANGGSLLCSAARRSAGWSLQAGTVSHSLGILWGPRVWAHCGWREVWCRGRTCFTFSSLLCIMSILCFFNIPPQ